MSGSNYSGRQAVQNGAKIVLAAGGDGTFNEVLNGIIDEETGNPLATFGMIPMGTGCDFVRNFGIDGKNYIETLEENQTADIDIIEVESTIDLPNGESEVRKRYCINEISFGISGNITKDVNTKKRVLLSKQAFYNFHTFSNLIFMKNKEVLLEFKENDTPQGRPRTVNQVVTALGNGMYFGAGMKICPHSDIISGKLALTCAENLGRVELVGLLMNVRKKDFDLRTNKKILTKHSSEIWAKPRLGQERIYAEMDGEPFGRLPLHVKKIHRCLRIIASRSFIAKLNKQGISLHYIPKLEKNEIEKKLDAHDETPSKNNSMQSNANHSHGNLVTSDMHDINLVENDPQVTSTTQKRQNVRSEKREKDSTSTLNQQNQQNQLNQQNQRNMENQTQKIQRNQQKNESANNCTEQISSNSSSQIKVNAPSDAPKSIDEEILKKCSLCNEMKPSIEFTSSQLKKKDLRKCKKCLN